MTSPTPATSHEDTVPVLATEVRIPTPGAELAGTLLLPAGGGRHPALVLVSGSGANDRDETVCGQTPFRVIAEFFARRNYAVLRYDDRGVGSSSGDARGQDFAGSVADVRAACAWLAAHPAVAPGRLVLLGHSEGGLVVAAAAREAPVRAIVMLAGPAVEIEEMLHEQAHALSVEAGATPRQIAHERQMNEQVFSLVRTIEGENERRERVRGVIRTHLASWPEVPPFEAQTVEDSAVAMADVVCAPAYRSLLLQRPASLLGAVLQPVFAAYGGKDIQVPGVTNAEACRGILKGTPDSVVQLFPELNHLFQRAGTGSISEYATLGTAPDAGVLAAVASWLGVVNK